MTLIRFGQVFKTNLESNFQEVGALISQTSQKRHDGRDGVMIEERYDSLIHINHNRDEGKNHELRHGYL